MDQTLDSKMAEPRLELQGERSKRYLKYLSIRQTTLALAAPLSPEDCAIQSMPDASPVKWHLAHVTWFFETFLLTPHLAGYQPFNSSFRVLFNSYYHAYARWANSLRRKPVGSFQGCGWQKTSEFMINTPIAGVFIVLIAILVIAKIS